MSGSAGIAAERRDHGSDKAYRKKLNAAQNLRRPVKFG